MPSQAVRSLPEPPLAWREVVPPQVARAASPDGLRAAVGLVTENCRRLNDSQGGVFVVGFRDWGGRPSAARAAGLLVGDRIHAIDGIEVNSSGHLTLEIEGIPPGNAARVVVSRDGRLLQPILVLTHRWQPADPLEARRPHRGSQCESIGMVYAELP